MFNPDIPFGALPDCLECLSLACNPTETGYCINSSVCLCCNKTHYKCKFGTHNQPNGYPCDRHKPHH